MGTAATDEWILSHDEFVHFSVTDDNQSFFWLTSTRANGSQVKVQLWTNGHLTWLCWNDSVEPKTNYFFAFLRSEQRRTDLATAMIEGSDIELQATCCHESANNITFKRETTIRGRSDARSYILEFTLPENDRHTVRAPVEMFHTLGHVLSLTDYSERMRYIDFVVRRKEPTGSARERMDVARLYSDEREDLCKAQERADEEYRILSAEAYEETGIYLPFS